MDTSDSVGWFIVDMRDLAGQRQQERWVKLQGASPAEVLISSSLAMARDPQQDSSKEWLEQQHGGRPATSGSNSSRIVGRRANPTGREEAQAASGEMPSPVVGAAVTTITAALSRSKPTQPSAVVAEIEVQSQEEGGQVAIHADGSSYSGRSSSSGSSSSFIPDSSAAVLSTSAAEAVSDLDALPVGPGADGADARTFSLAISVMGAAGLSPLIAAAVSRADVADAGFWLSYSIFGVVVQTDRFEGLVPPPPGDRAVLEPMMDSFRLRATLQGLCQFLGEAPPLQVGQQMLVQYSRMPLTPGRRVFVLLSFRSVHAVVLLLSSVRAGHFAIREFLSWPFSLAGVSRPRSPS